jgi:hypothetical protein
VFVCKLTLRSCFSYYNLCSIHTTLRATPAMKAKLTDHVWELAELLA